MRSLDRDLAELGVLLLQRALAAGIREAGLELANLPGHLDPELSGLSKAERAQFLEESALAGNSLDALELYYSYGSALPTARLRAALEAASEGSSEVREILDDPTSFTLDRQ